MASRRLCDVPPREEVGAETGLRYEYQHLQAAGACLDLLEVSDSGCVFCEWHDDFVVEHPHVECTLYAFYQVKTKSLSKGPWKPAELFGVDLRKKTGTVDDGAIVPRMVEHYLNFPDECLRVVLITNTGVHPDVSDLMDEVSQAHSPGALTGETKKKFTRLVSAYGSLGANLGAESVFAFLKKLAIRPAIGTVDSAQFESNYHLLAGRILHLSEIDLKFGQAVVIARDLVELAKRKARPITFPLSEEELRASKGVMPDEVLSVLTLSPEGYRELRAHGVAGRDTVRALSRLQRLGDASGLPPAVVRDVCRMKTQWDLWERACGQVLSGVDGIQLRTECQELLAMHAGGHLKFSALSERAEEIALAFGPRIMSLEPLTRELVLGCVFALAAARGS